LKVNAVFSSSGGLELSGFEDLRRLSKYAVEGFKLSQVPGFKEGMHPLDYVGGGDVDIAFFAIPPNYLIGEPNTKLFLGMLREGVSVVTADKTVLARGFWRVIKYAEENEASVGYRATVAAGTPVVDVAWALRSRGVVRLRAIFNATTNYILGLIEEGLTYDEALKRAKAEKVVEPDPTVDTHGWDPGAKLAIVSSIIAGRDVTVFDVRKTPLEAVDFSDIKKVVKEGWRVKYVAEANFKSSEFVVKPELIPRGDPLYDVVGHRNVAVFEVEDDAIVVKGPAGPARRTARTLLADAMSVLNRSGRP